jgi:hypothetical protein
MNPLKKVALRHILVTYTGGTSRYVLAIGSRHPHSVDSRVHGTGTCAWHVLSTRRTLKKIPSKVRENGRESSLCGESMKIPSKVGNAILREKLPHNFVGISPSISE